MNAPPQRLIPARIRPPAKPLNGLAFLAAFVRNPLEAVPQAAYEEDLVTGRLAGAQRLWITSPALVKTVLLDEREKFQKLSQIRLLSPLLGGMFGLPMRATLVLALSLLIGTPSVSALGAIGAGLTLSIRRGGLILPLLVLPLLAPAVIFGAGAVQSTLDGLSDGALLFLSAFSVAATVLSPFAAAAAVRLNLAG